MENNKEILEKLKALSIQANFEQTFSIYLKNAVTIGENQNGAVICTYIDRSLNEFYDIDHMTINVIFDEHECDLYGKDYEFSFIIFKPENNYKPTYIVGMSDDATVSKDGIELFPNALELILAELEASGSEWIEKQMQMRIRSRYFHRNAVWKHTEQFEHLHTPLTWEERKESVALDGEIDWLMWRRPREFTSGLKTLQRMEDLGEEAYNANEKKMCDLMREIMSEKKFK